MARATTALLCNEGLDTQIGEASRRAAPALYHPHGDMEREQGQEGVPILITGLGVAITLASLDGLLKTLTRFYTKR